MRKKNRAKQNPTDLNLLGMLRHQMANISTELFRQSHVVYCCDPDKDHNIGVLASRIVDTSTILIMDREAVNKLQREILTVWRDVQSEVAANQVRELNEYRWTQQTFKAFVQSNTIRSGFYEIYIQYSIAWSQRLNRCVIHHIEDSTIYMGLGSGFGVRSYI